MQKGKDVFIDPESTADGEVRPGAMVM